MALVHEGLVRVMKALTPIAKEGAAGVNYKFRSIDAVFNQLHVLLADNGLWLRPVVLDDWQINLIPGTKDRQQGQALFRVELFACAEDDSTHSLGIGLAQSHDYGDKAAYQAQQNAVKYILIEAFAIPTDEPDMDARESEAAPADYGTPPEPTRTDVEMSPGDWLKTSVEAFAKWTSDERNNAFKDAMASLEFLRVSSMTRAKEVFDKMAEAYYEDHPETGLF